MTFLLDVNVLYILHQPRHTDFQLVDDWFTFHRQSRFATSPITQAGLVRLLMRNLSQMETYIREEATLSLRQFTRLPNHVYWPDSPSYLEAVDAIMARVQGHRQITDAYLLGLAIHNGGKLATLDRGIVHLAGPDFAGHVEYIARETTFPATAKRAAG
jgi:toxin-antitoxin system PIN domain toxin